MNCVKLFHWTAYNQQGEVQHGKIVAFSLRQADNLLQNQGLCPVEIHQQFLVATLSQTTINNSLFFLQLSQLLRAGLPLSEGLQLLSKATSILIWQQLLQQINLDIRNGSLLSASLQQWPALFSPFSVALITAGEATGQLELCCLRIADLHRQQRHIRETIMKAIRYPLLVLILTCLVVMVIISVILPQFSYLYSSLNLPLPFITQRLISSSTYLVWGLPITVLLFWLLWLIHCYLYHHNAVFRLWVSELIGHLPVLRTLWQAAILSKIFSLLAITQQAGISLLISLDMTSLSIQCPLWKIQINHLKQRIQGGYTIANAINSLLWPPLCYSMLYPAEKTGNLEQGFQQISHWYQTCFLQGCDRLILFLQPVIMLIAGMITGGLLLAIYLPILQLATDIN